MHKHLSASQEQSFYQQGYARLGQVVDGDELAALQQRIDEIMLGEVRYEGMMMQLDSDSGSYGDLDAQTPGFKGATLKYRKIEQLEKDPLFLQYLKSPLIESISRSLIGEEVSIYRSMFMNKPAGFGTLLPWHQDAGKQWGLNSDPYVTIWLALDPATIENGCVQVIPGSHKLGLLSEHGHTITPQQEQDYCRGEDIVYCELQAGEAMLLHNNLLHRSDKNNSTRSRRAFSVCLMDAATRCVRTPQRQFPKLFGRNALQVPQTATL